MHDIFRLGYKVSMSASETDTAELMLYGQIVEDGPKWWKWSEEDKSAAEFKKAIEEIREKGATKLLLRINSPGGVCTESVAMRSILGNAGFDEVNIRIEGMCASAATDIATLPGAHVAITEGSEYMIHNPWCMCIGNANEMEHTIERLRNIEEVSRGFYMKRTGQSEEQIKEWMDAETWFTAKEAVEYGFADELLEADVSNETPAAALAVMHDLYRSVPEQMIVSNGAGGPTEIDYSEKEENAMELGNITLEQLREGNPALYEQVQQAAVDAERERLSDIDALTIPGYEQMATEAKENGTSVMDFQKQLVAAMKQKGRDFMAARAQETAPAAEVAGGDPVSNTPTEEDEIKAEAKKIADMAAQMVSSQTGMF